MRYLCSLVLALLPLTCLHAAQDGEEFPPWFHDDSNVDDVVGTWRGVLAFPGGELPFTFRINPTGSQPPAVILNGAEEAPVGSVAYAEPHVSMRFEWYDAQLIAVVSYDGQSMRGKWTRTTGDGQARLEFSATRDDTRRFLGPPTGIDPAGDTPVLSVHGRWAVTFEDRAGTTEAVGEFTQDGSRVTGTFLTPTGDYRYLEGDYAGGWLRLSGFDGSHAFLFHARALEDGSLIGDFWSRDSYHATWKAHRIEDGEDASPLPDPWSMVRITNDENQFRFIGRDLNGEDLSLADEQFAGRVVLVNIFGSWCPNCHDEAPFLQRLYERHRDAGLSVVGIAFEYRGNHEADAAVVRAFAERHGVTYPIVIAGKPDKRLIPQVLPDIDRLIAYPTTILIGRDRTVRGIHSGFSGPATGAEHEELVKEISSRVERLLAEPPPPTVPAPERGG